MNYTIIVKRDVAKDFTKRNQLIEQLHKINGVLKIDTEMAHNCLVLAQLSEHTDLEAIRQIDGVDDLEKNGVKHTCNIKRTG